MAPRLARPVLTAELEAASTLKLDDAITDFSGDTTLAKLRASIAADLIAEKPDVALDRVHTYCAKRFRHLLAERGQPIDAKIPLDAIFGAYGRMLRDEGLVSEFALRPTPPLRRSQPGAQQAFACPRQRAAGHL